MTQRRVLIDECLPIQLHQWLDGFDARTVAFMGWAGRRDGELLEAARDVFDVVLTSDALMHPSTTSRLTGSGSSWCRRTGRASCDNWFRQSVTR